MKAGFIGTGSIGAPLATNILDQEKSLAVFDINPEATKSLAEKQARILPSPKAVADEAEVVFACMPTMESFHAVVTGTNGVLGGEAMVSASSSKYAGATRTKPLAVLCARFGRSYSLRTAVSVQSGGEDLLLNPRNGLRVSACSSASSSLR